MIQDFVETHICAVCQDAETRGEYRAQLTTTMSIKKMRIATWYAIIGDFWPAMQQLKAPVNTHLVCIS